MIQFLGGVRDVCASLNLVSPEARPAEVMTALQSEELMGRAIGTLREVGSTVTRTASGAPLTDAQVFFRLLDGQGVRPTDEIAALRRSHDADTTTVTNGQVFGEIVTVLGKNSDLFPSERLKLRHGERVVVRLAEDVEAEVDYRVVGGKLEITLSHRPEGEAYPADTAFEAPSVYINDELQRLKRGRSVGYDSRPPFYYFKREIPLEDLPAHTFVAFHHKGVTKIVDVEVVRVADSLFEQRAPLFDLFHGGRVLDLEKHRAKVRAAAEKAKGFRERMEGVRALADKAERLIAYRAIEDDIGLDRLSTADTTQLLYAYKNDGQWADVARLYETSPNQAFRDSQVIKEFYIVALNKLGRVMESIKTSKAYIDQGHSNGEVWAGLGKAHRLRSEAAYALAREMEKADEERDEAKLERLTAEYRKYFGTDPTDPEMSGMSALNESYDCYLRGYLVDLEYYPGVNAVYNLLELNKEAKAKGLARMVYFSTLQAGGKESTDYWCVTTMLELAVILENEAEIDDMLPRVLARVRHDWEADSSLAQLRKVAARRREAGRETAKLDFVIAQLEKRKNHQGRSVAETNPEVAPIRVEEATSEAKKVTDMILAKSFHYKGLNSSFISGNARFGGQLHDHVVNRADLKLARDLLTTLGLTAETDFEVFNGRVDAALAKMLDFVDPETGERSLEKYHGEHHKLFDRFMQKLLDYSGARDFGDSRTNVFVDLAIGRGDCRQAAYTKQLLFDIWRQDRITSMMREAYGLLMRNKEADYKAQLGAIENLVRTQLVVMDVKVQGKIRMNGGKQAPHGG